jgi:DNA repair protein RecO (recombination protein O)
MPVEYRTRALVLRTFDQGESDRVVHLYTETQGRVSAIAKGARRSKRRFPGTLEILSLIDVRLVDPPRAQLMRLEGAKLSSAFEGITSSLTRYAIACQFLELLDRLTAEREAHAELFHFAVGVLDVLREADADRLLAVLVLAKTLARLGYRPQLTRCAVCGAEPAASVTQIAFLPAQGGSVCRNCAGPAEGTVPLRLLRALDAGLRQPLRATSSAWSSWSSASSVSRSAATCAPPRSCGKRSPTPRNLLAIRARLTAPRSAEILRPRPLRSASLTESSPTGRPRAWRSEHGRRTRCRHAEPRSSRSAASTSSAADAPTGMRRLRTCSAARARTSPR